MYKIAHDNPILKGMLCYIITHYMKYLIFSLKAPNTTLRLIL